eukprot:1775678-Prymnesium_polylepis.1
MSAQSACAFVAAAARSALAAAVVAAGTVNRAHRRQERSDPAVVQRRAWVWCRSVCHCEPLPISMPVTKAAFAASSTRFSPVPHPSSMQRCVRRSRPLATYL